MNDDKVIFHIDVNNAFLSWSAVKLLEEGYPIDIRTIPSVIGGDESKRHGIVLAKSPIAKKNGICTAETIYSARKKCKNLKVFPMEMEFYSKKSKEMFDYLSNFTANMEIFSIDECYLDFSGYNLLYDDFLKLAYRIKNDIYEKFGFTVNIGIGNNKLCAKMASDFEKPNKVHTLYKNEIYKKMWPLEINNLFMVGKNTAYKLKELGLNTIGDVAKADIKFLKKKFKSHGILMWEYSNGIDNSEVLSERKNVKSMSISETLQTDTDNVDVLKNVLLRQSTTIGKSLRKTNQYTMFIAIIMKTCDFISYIKQERIINPINSDDDIYKCVISIFEKYWSGDKIRSIGIRLGDFVDDCYYQISIFDDNPLKIQKPDQTIDRIKEKYGEKIINKASLLKK